MGNHRHWSESAACKGARPDELFVRGSAQNRVKQVCSTCPVRTECLAEALDNSIEWGIWGGMTERERRLLLRQRPDVTSWSAVLLPKPEQPAENSRAQSLSAKSSPTRRNALRSVTSVGNA